MLVFEINLITAMQKIAWDLSMMKISCKLTKRITKTEKIEKCLKIFKMYIINVKNIRHKLTGWVDINQSIVKYKLIRPVSILRLPKEKNKQRQQIKKMSKKCDPTELDDVVRKNFELIHVSSIIATTCKHYH